MKTIYVVTDTRTRPSFRRVLAAVAALTLLAGAVLGHTVVQLLGAADALLAAVLGLRRTRCFGGIATAVRQTWEA